MFSILAPAEYRPRELEFLRKVLRRRSNAAAYARRRRLINRDWRHLDELRG